LGFPGDRRVLTRDALLGARIADLAQARAVHALPGDERRAARGAALLAVRVGEPHPLVRDAVDVRGAVAHHAVAVTAEVADPDVVPPEDHDVRPARVRHVPLPRLVGMAGTLPNALGRVNAEPVREPRIASLAKRAGKNRVVGA